MTKFIIDELEISSDDSYEEVSDERFVTKNRLKLNIMIMAHQMAAKQKMFIVLNWFEVV